MSVIFELRLSKIAKTTSRNGKTLQQFMKWYWKKFGVVPTIQKLHKKFPDLNLEDLAIIQGKAKREFEEGF